MPPIEDLIDISRKRLHQMERSEIQDPDEDDDDVIAEEPLDDD
jgi:hypothetical protein